MASLRATLAKAVKSAFAATGDIAFTVTLRMRPSGDYDPETGKTTTVYQYNVDVKVLPTTLDTSTGNSTVQEASQGQGSVVSDKDVYILQASDLPLVDGKRLKIIPLSDVVEIDGEEYAISDAKPDPLKLTYTLTLRNT